MKIKNICIIVDGYPSDRRVINTFVEELVNSFSNYKINCYVISPQSLTRVIINHNPINKKKYYRYISNGRKTIVYSPFYFTFSNFKRIINSQKLNLFFFYHAVNKVFKKISKSIKFDVIYAHFIFPSAIVANKIGKKYNIPVFFAYGECSDYTIKYLGMNETKKLLDGVNGVISVSEDNKKRLIEYKIVDEKLIKVFPNGIAKNNFYKKDKNKIRKILGYNKDDFIVCFTGRFIESKGINRLCEALNLLNNKNIKAIFIGSGKIKPNYSNTLFCGPLNHNEINDYLNASDIFVLPTLEEGCCNSIIEAMACGLPIISSNKPFNDEILDDNCSIRIDSSNINDIKNSIELLYNDRMLRKKMSKNAKIKSLEFDINDRAKNILEFMKSNI